MKTKTMRSPGESFAADKPSQWWRDDTQVPMKPAWLTGELERKWPETQFAVQVVQSQDDGGRRKARYEYKLHWFAGPTSERVATYLESELARHPDIEFMLNRSLRIRNDIGRRLYKRLDPKVKP